MATATKTKTKRDVLPEEELEKYQLTESVLVAGMPYLWIMDFGWAKIGFYVKHLAPNRILVAHCNHFRNAGKDYGRLATEGAGSDCEWRDCVGDKLIMALAQEVEALREALKACVDAKDNAVWDAEGVSQDSVDRMLEVAEKARQVLVGN